jgi:hypothetical protein
METCSFNKFKRCLLVVVLSLLCVQAVRAQTYLSVTCTNDGNGLYSYTFSKGTSSLYFYAVTTNTSILVPSHGVLQTFQPEGWSSSVGTNGWVTWMPTNNIQYLNAPTTFSILSSYKVPRDYNDWPPFSGPFSQGFLTGDLMTNRNDIAVSGTYYIFPFVGPDPNPIPTLLMQQAGTNLVVSWPAAISEFNLESSSNLSQTANWTTVTNEPVIVGNQFCVTNPISAGPVFFRLSK